MVSSELKSFTVFCSDQVLSSLQIRRCGNDSRGGAQDPNLVLCLPSHSGLSRHDFGVRSRCLWAEDRQRPRPGSNTAGHKLAKGIQLLHQLLRSLRHGSSFESSSQHCGFATVPYLGQISRQDASQDVQPLHEAAGYEMGQDLPRLH